MRAAGERVSAETKRELLTGTETALLGAEVGAGIGIYVGSIACDAVCEVPTEPQSVPALDSPDMVFAGTFIGGAILGATIAAGIRKLVKK